ncbi:MAG: flagellar basal body P-ring protein FlgI, partial [Acidobacteria bacterium]|nr:flagellar basal body P-ring protein FlgI [Acidobacteriota bacterium]
FAGPLEAASRIKDVAVFEGVRDNQLFGYGLVTGLNGTGDGTQTYFSTQTLSNMLERSGITIDPGRMRTKNIAAVMVTATLPPFARQGSRIDVTVSSLGDAKSLQGGELIMTPLLSADGQVYAVAQGTIVLGGYSAAGGSTRAQTNHPTAGRISNGGLVEKEIEADISGLRQLNLVLHRNDFTSASRATKAINDLWGYNIAEAVDGRTIRVRIPVGYSGSVVEFMAMIENARVEIDNAARVVLNERTGTVVLGKDVSVSEVSIIHGSLSLQVGTAFTASQPNPLSFGETVLVPEETLNVVEEPGHTATIREGASVEEIVRALNDIGATPRDIIAILQAIKAQGALAAELEII